MGIYCSHAYPYRTSAIFGEDGGVRTTLKGTDMAMYAVFKTLGLEIQFKPVLHDISQIDCDYNEGLEDDEDDEEDLYIGDRPPGAAVLTPMGENEGDTADDVAKEFGTRARDGVHWVTTPLWKDLGMVHLTVCSFLFPP